MIIIIDQKEYAVGLNWFAISSTHEVEQFQRDMEMHHGILKMSKDSNVQSTVALCGPEYNGQISLAGMLSFAYQNLVYVTATEFKDEKGDPLYYLCAIKNHAVTVEGDVVGNRETIGPLFAQNYADITADIDPSTVNCFGTGVDEGLFPGVHLIESHQVLDQALRYASQATIKPLAKSQLTKGTLVLLVALVGIGGYLVWSFFLKPPPPPPPPPPVRNVAPAPVVPQRAPRDVFMDEFKASLALQPRPEVIPAVVNKIKQMPMAFGGWQIKEIDFAAENANNLHLMLDRSSLANVEDLMLHNDRGFFNGVQVDQTGNHAVAEYPFAHEDFPILDADAFASLSETSTPRYYELIGKLQSSNIPYDGKAGIRNAYFGENELSFKGVGLWSLLALYEALLPFDTLAVKSIKITIENGNYNWTIEGVIYG